MLSLSSKSLAPAKRVRIGVEGRIFNEKALGVAPSNFIIRLDLFFGKRRSFFFASENDFPSVSVSAEPP